VSSVDGDDPPAPGWRAIDEALVPLYGRREPDAHFGTVVPYALGGPDPIQGISAYWRADPRAHWHIVTLGLTELYEKESDDPDVSGFGFEFTFRLACAQRERQPPTWALSFLQNLGRYVFESGNRFDVGHTMDLNGPIQAGAPTAIRAIVVAADPELPPQRTPNGRMQFLQVVGVTRTELDAARSWNSESFLRVLATRVPLLMTDLARDAVTDLRDVREQIADGIRRDGSSQESVQTESATWRVDGRQLRLELGALHVASVRLALEGRIPHGRSFRVFGPVGPPICLVPGEPAGWRVEADGEAVVAFSPQAARDVLRDLQPKRGTYTWATLPGVVVQVAPTPVTDNHGNVIEVIG
jgi:hypothetical protein